MGKFLNRAQFQLFSPGPRINPVPQFPKKPKAGSANAVVLNHCVKDFGPLTLPAQFGREASPPVPVASSGDRANPLSITVMPENVQFPRTLPNTSLRFFKKGRS